MARNPSRRSSWPSRASPCRRNGRCKTQKSRRRTSISSWQWISPTTIGPCKGTGAERHSAVSPCIAMAGNLPELALEAREISKSFGATPALDRVGIAVRAGEVHALVGENGAGKSTLMNVICGALRPDAGTISLGGSPVQVQSPHHAMQLGITIVHQHSALAPALTVAENIFLGRLPHTRLGFIDWRQLFRQARELVTALNFDLD